MWILPVRTSTAHTGARRHHMYTLTLPPLDPVTEVKVVMCEVQLYLHTKHNCFIFPPVSHPGIHALSLMCFMLLMMTFLNCLVSVLVFCVALFVGFSVNTWPLRE